MANEEKVMDLLERATIALETIARNTETMSENVAMVAIGVAKVVERCFCGHRLDEHFATEDDEGTGCKAAGCRDCNKFLPLHLALVRILNSGAHDFQQLAKRLSSLLPEPDASPGGIVSPFKTH